MSPYAKGLAPFPHPERPLIGLNGRFLVAQRTGVQRSAYRLFRQIIEQGTEFNFLIFTGESELSAPEWNYPHVRVIASKLRSQDVLRNHLWEQFLLPYYAKRYRVDILHNPANLAPLLFKGRNVVNIHDLCFLIEPSWFNIRFRTVYRWLVPAIAKRAAMIITNSNYSKNDILEYLDVPLNRVRMSYWAVDPVFSQHVTPYDQRKDHMLYVGSIEPRKNLTGLLEAFNLFRSRNRHSACKLRIVGCENKLFASQRFDLGPFEKDIEFLGYVTDQELAMLYSESKMLVYPSFYEGFGFPPLEAMATGTPVITSKNSSLPEIVQDAALLVDPALPTEIASRMEALYFDPNTCDHLIQKGLLRAASFSWRHVAEHTLAIYHELLKTH